MDITMAIKTLKKEADNTCLSKEFREAIKTVVEKAEEACRGDDTCKYFAEGRCLGQKGTPQCDRGYCPYKKGPNKCK